MVLVLLHSCPIAEPVDDMESSLSCHCSVPSQSCLGPPAQLDHILGKVRAAQLWEQLRASHLLPSSACVVLNARKEPLQEKENMEFLHPPRGCVISIS